MAIVGQASVVVRALADTFRQDLRRQFSQAEGDADKFGERAGGRFSGSFNAAVNEQLSFDFGGVEDEAGRSGDNAGKSWFQRFRDNLKRINAERLDGLEAEGARAGDASGSGFFSRFTGRLGGLGDGLRGIFGNIRRDAEVGGDDAGRSFGDRMSQGVQLALFDMEQGAQHAADNITRDLSAIKVDLPDFGGEFAGKILTLIPLVGVLGGGLAALVGALSAVAAAAVYAAGSLAVLSTGIAAIGLGAITAFLAFSGISKALGALNTQQAKSAAGAVGTGRSYGQMADAIRSAQQRLQDAEYSLQQARHNAAEQAVQDAHSVADAEYNLQQAQQNAKDAQEALTQAREDAKSKLEDLQLQLRGSVLGEEEAALRLQKAQQEYQKVLNDPGATEQDREQARLNLEEAELSADEAKKRHQDVSKAAEEANKKGVDGADNVVAAQRRVNDSQHSVAEAEYALAQARQRQADDAIKAQHDIAKALQEVANAQRALQKAHEGTGAAAARAGQAAQAALAKLTPEARAFAEYLFSLKPKLDELKTAAGSKLFGPLKTDLQDLVKNFFPVFKQAITDVSGGLADFFGSITKAFTSSDFLANFGGLAKALTEIRGGKSDFGIMGEIIGNLVKAFTGLARAAEPLFRRFLNYLDQLTGGWANAFKDNTGVAKVAATLKGMGDAAALFAHTLGDVFGLLLDIFGQGGNKSGVAAGLGFVKDFDNAIKRLDDHLKTPGGRKSLTDFFAKIKGPAEAAGRLIARLVKEFLKLGENGDLTKIFDKITAALPTVRDAIETFTNKVAPALIDIITKIIQIFDRVVHSPAFPIFVSVIKGITSAIGLFIKVLDIGPIGKFAGALLGLVAAYAALKKVGKVTGLSALTGSIKQGIADPRTTRAQKATGLGAAIQGARGNRIIDPSRTIKDVEGNVLAERPSRANQIGGFLGGRNTLGGARHAKPGVLGTTGRKVAAGAAVATIGVGIVEALSTNNLKSLHGIATAAGDILTANIGTVLTLAGPSIVSKLGEGIKKGAPLLGDGVKALGGFLKGRLAQMGGDAGFIDFGAKAGKGAKVVGETEKVGGAFSKFAGVGSKLAGVGSSLAGVFSSIGAAIVPMLPIIAIVAAVAALAIGFYELYKHSKTFRDIVNSIGRALKSFGEFIVKVVVKAFDFMKSHLQFLLVALGPLGVAVLGIIEIFKHWDDIKKIVKAVIDFVTGLFSSMWHAITGFLGSLWKDISGFVGSLVTGFQNRVSQIVDTVVGFFKALPGRVVAFATGLYNAAKSLGQNIWNGIVNIVSGIASKVGSFIGAIPGAITGFLGRIGSAAASIGSKIWNSITGAVTGIAGKVGSFLSGIPGALLGLVSKVGSAAASIGAAIWNNLKSGLIKAVSGGLDLAKSIFNSLVGLLNKYLIDGINGAIHFKVNTHIPGVGTIQLVPSSINIPRIPTLAAGATILPRAGGTLALLAEAGKPETVVDTGLINRQLARANERADGSAAIVAELQRLQAILARVEQLGGINIEKIEAHSHTGEDVATSVPRSLRSLAFELGA